MPDGSHRASASLMRLRARRADRSPTWAEDCHLRLPSALSGRYNARLASGISRTTSESDIRHIHKRSGIEAERFSESGEDRLPQVSDRLVTAHIRHQDVLQ